MAKYDFTNYSKSVNSKAGRPWCGKYGCLFYGHYHSYVQSLLATILWLAQGSMENLPFKRPKVFSDTRDGSLDSFKDSRVTFHSLGVYTLSTKKRYRGVSDSTTLPFNVVTGAPKKVDFPPHPVPISLPFPWGIHSPGVTVPSATGDDQTCSSGIDQKGFLLQILPDSKDKRRVETDSRYSLFKHFYSYATLQYDRPSNKHSVIRDWFIALKFQDAYFHVAIHPAPWHFLRFIVGTNHYQHHVLPFSVIARLVVFPLSGWLTPPGLSFPQSPVCHQEGPSSIPLPKPLLQHRIINLDAYITHRIYWGHPRHRFGMISDLISTVQPKNHHEGLSSAPGTHGSLNFCKPPSPHPTSKSAFLVSSSLAQDNLMLPMSTSCPGKYHSLGWYLTP